MPSRYKCRQTQAGPIDVSRQPAMVQHPVYGNVRFANTADHLPDPTGSMSSLASPPPPYRAHDGDVWLPQMAVHGYPPAHASHQYLQQAHAAMSSLQLSEVETGGARDKQGWHSTTNLNLVSQRPAQHGHPSCPITRGMNQGAALVDCLASRLHDVLGRTDDQQTQADFYALTEALALNDGIDGTPSGSRTRPARRRSDEGQDKPGHSILNFKKSWLYKNSRLPPGMVPFKAYLPAWSLISRGAQASITVYDRPRKDERAFYTEADPQHGTKAMIVKTQAMDDHHLIVVAIRGSQFNLVDWCVNLRPAPTQPTGFLDDEGNACHAGFLHVARSMIAPVAARLRDLIQQDSTCTGSSLLFTGHSAGGAVASLLYAHMLSSAIVSDLTDLAGIFKRIHCVTFGTPPISLLPLQKPKHRRASKDLFFSFVNEGDPVTRLDSWDYFMSLMSLVRAPAPTTSAHHGLRGKASRQHLRQRASRQHMKSNDSLAFTPRSAQKWPVPDATLSVGGRAVLLRQVPNRTPAVAEAVQVTDGELRGRMFGDVAMHSMVLYKKRVDELAFAAVSGRDAG